MALLEQQLLGGGLTEAEVQAALSRPDVISTDIDQRVRSIRTSGRKRVDASMAGATLVAAVLFALVIVRSRRAKQRRAESSRLLAEREQRYRLMVESLQEGVLIFDAEARAQAGNSAAERILGISVEQAQDAGRGQWHAHVENGAQVSADDEPVARAMRTGQPIRDITLHICRQQHEPIWLVATAVPLHVEAEGGSRRGAVVTFADVTADRGPRHAAGAGRERIDQPGADGRVARRRGRRAGRCLRACESVARASDRRRPRGVRRPAVRGRRRSEGERLARVAVAAQELLRPLDDILDISQIDACKLVLDDTEFTLEALPDSACVMVTDAARDKGVALLIETDHVPQRLRGDPMRLSQALVNLLGNAVKFIENGSVTLAARLLEQRATRCGCGSRCATTGSGIAADKLETLFDAFEQADSATTRRFGSTGPGWRSHTSSRS